MPSLAPLSAAQAYRGERPDSVGKPLRSRFRCVLDLQGQEMNKDATRTFYTRTKSVLAWSS